MRGRAPEPGIPCKNQTRFGACKAVAAMASKPVVVAIVNTNPDIVRMLRIALERSGFIAVVLHIEQLKTGAADLDAFLRDHDPRVIIYDVPPPFEENWRFLTHLRSNPGVRNRQFVVTTMNRDAVLRHVQPAEDIYEVIGHGEDIAEIVQAVREASRVRDTR